MNGNTNARPTLVQWMYKPDQAYLLDLAENLGRKFEAYDLDGNARLVSIAEDLIHHLNQVAWNKGIVDFLKSMADAQDRYGRLTQGQRKGVLNCAVSELKAGIRKGVNAPAPTSTATPAPSRVPVAGGTYILELPDGTMRTFVVPTDGGAVIEALRVLLAASQPAPVETPRATRKVSVSFRKEETGGLTGDKGVEAWRNARTPVAPQDRANDAAAPSTTALAPESVQGNPQDMTDAELVKKYGALSQAQYEAGDGFAPLSQVEVF